MFQKGKSYRRLDIHEQFGGRQQSGISNCPKHPYIFIWTKRKEEQDVYEDKWEDNYYLYSGEGRIGDQKFTGGNKSIRDHKINGKTIFLFEKDYKNSGYWIFINEMSLKGCYNYKNHDELGNLRTCIRFQLKPLDQLSAKKKKDNPNIFIFTAGDKNARKHLNDSVITSIKYSLINFHLDSRFISRISSSSSGSSKDEFFAWGAVEGPVNIRNWKKIQSGDYILCVFDNKYQYLSKILDKTINKELAAKIWGLNNEGKTWEYMYFFDKPVKVNIPLISLSNYMNAKYLGFTSISKEKLDKIVNDFSSIEVFLNKKLLNFKSSAKNITPKENSKTEINNVVQKKTFYKKFTNDDENSLSYVDMPNPTNNNSNSMEFHAQHTKMSTSFFDVQKRFRIPRYQRPYSWEKAQVEELWSDLLKHNRGTFFVGSVIFNKRREDDLELLTLLMVNKDFDLNNFSKSTFK